MNSAIAGSSVANVLTVLVFAVVNCIRKRLNKSKCQSHCYIFDCEAQLEDLKHVKSEVLTQRGLIQNVIEILDSKSVFIDSSSGNTDPIPPKKKNKEPSVEEID